MIDIIVVAVVVDVIAAVGTVGVGTVVVIMIGVEVVGVVAAVGAGDIVHGVL